MPNNKNKILVIALSGIGDALMFTPALRHLRQNMPGSVIDALVMFKGVRDIYSSNGDIDHVLYFDFMKEGPVRSLKYLLGLRGEYGTSINVYPSNRREYNIFSFILGAEKRAGVDYKRGGSMNFSFLNNLHIRENDLLHNVEENILMAEMITGKASEENIPLILNTSEEEIKAAEEYFGQAGISGSDLVVGIHPGCQTLKNHIMRRWPADNFAGLAKKLIADFNAKVLLFGGPEEKQLREEIMLKAGSDSVMEPSAPSLTASAAIMKRCQVFVSNDSSLMHVASALGLKVVALIGPTNVNYIRPWMTAHKIVSLNLDCAPCFFYSPKPLSCSRTDVQYKCIRELGVDRVYEAVKGFV